MFTQSSNESPAPIGAPPGAQIARIGIRTNDRLPAHLDDDNLHVWRIRLDDQRFGGLDLETFLDEADRERARRFKFDVHRRRFILARAGMRMILGTYLHMPPQRIRFRYGMHGKPTLSGDCAETGIRFNLSHAHHLALLAITRHCQIGIDVEYLRPETRVVQIAHRYFSPQEAQLIDRLPASRQSETFFRFWTLKEAYLKACGAGLSMGLDRLEVRLAETGVATVNLLTPDIRCRFLELDPGDGYVAALVVKGRKFQLGGWDWSAAGS